MDCELIKQITWNFHWHFGVWHLESNESAPRANLLVSGIQIRFQKIWPITNTKDLETGFGYDLIKRGPEWWIYLSSMIHVYTAILKPKLDLGSVEEGQSTQLFPNPGGICPIILSPPTKVLIISTCSSFKVKVQIQCATYFRQCLYPLLHHCAMAIIVPWQLDHSRRNLALKFLFTNYSPALRFLWRSKINYGTARAMHIAKGWSTVSFSCDIVAQGSSITTLKGLLLHYPTAWRDFRFRNTMSTSKLKS